MFSRVPRLKAIPGTTLWTGFFFASCLYCFMGWTTCALSHWSRVTAIYICLFGREKKFSSLQQTNVKECFTCHLHLHLHHHHHQHLGISSWKTLWTDCKTIQHPLLQNCSAGCLRMSWPRPQAKSRILRLPFIPSIKPGAWRYTNLDSTEKSCSKKGTVDFTWKLRFVGLSTGFNKQKVSRSPKKKKTAVQAAFTNTKSMFSHFSRHVRLLYHHYSKTNTQKFSVPSQENSHARTPNQPPPPKDPANKVLLNCILH